MSFRKRSIGLGATQGENTTIRGVRPSPLDGRPTTSTGTQSLDALLAGHAGLAVGTSLLLEESGTTDFGGSLLRHYAAEGIVQGHHVHVLGMNEFWGRDLPALADESHGSERSSGSGEKMKIAWRYERLGDFGSGFRGMCTMNNESLRRGEIHVKRALRLTWCREDNTIKQGRRQKSINLLSQV